MREIRNLTTEPLRITLPGGKILHLGPGKTAQIADKAAESPSLKRLAKEGSIEILAEGDEGAASNPRQIAERENSPFRRGKG